MAKSEFPSVLGAIDFEGWMLGDSGYCVQWWIAHTPIAAWNLSFAVIERTFGLLKMGSVFKMSQVEGRRQITGLKKALC